MAEGCGASCAKFMLIVFNIIFWLSGCAILAVGLWIRFDRNIFDIIGLVNVSETDPLLIYVAYAMIAIGAFILIVGFLGCCGAIKESKCMLGLYIFLLFIVFAAELAAGIYVLIMKDDLMMDAKDFVYTKIRSDPLIDENDDFTVIGSTLNYVQHTLTCCGINNYTDYQGSNYTQTSGQPFPFSCCELTESSTDPRDVKEDNVKDWTKCQAMEPGFFYNEGCYAGLQNFVDQNSIILIGMGIGLACLELFGLIFAICLCQNTSGKDD